MMLNNYIKENIRKLQLMNLVIRYRTADKELQMNYIMHDFAHRYQRDELSEILYYNQERQKFADKTIHYNDLKLKQSKVFYKLCKNSSVIEKLQNNIDKLASEIWSNKKS